MEEMLKSIFESIPNMQKKILSHAELSEYITWLIQTKHSFYSTDTNDWLLRSNEKLNELAGEIVRHPNDSALLNKLSSSFASQNEEGFLLSNHDISVGRMFRYMPAHWHTNEYFEIYYCFSGTCPIHFSDEIINMKPGTVLIVAPFVLHASPCYSDDSVLYYYMVRSSTFDKVFWNQLPQDNLLYSFFKKALGHEKHASYLHFETDCDPQVEQLLEQINLEFAKPSSYSSQMLNALMSAFFILLLRKYEGTVKLPRTEDFYWKQEFSAIFAYIQSNYATVNQTELAEHFHYSERQIGRIVQNCMGMTYNQLIAKLRMEKAAAMLKQHIGIEVVSAAVGYSTLSSFYRAFTKYYGISPAKFQKESDQ